MVVALLALSLVMILGGSAAVVQGFPYVRLESGLAMVIGGSTAASAGVILLGLTTLLDRLRKIQGSLAGLGADNLEAAAAPVVPATAAAPWDATPQAAPAVAAPEVIPPERPSLAGMGTAGLAGLSLGALRPGGRGAEPVFEDSAPAEPLLPDLLPAASPEAVPPRGSDATDEDLFGTPERHPPVFAEPDPVAVTAAPAPAEERPAEERTEAAMPVPEPIGLRSSLEEPAPAPEPVEPPEPEAAAPAAEVPEADPQEERHAVGSYASGANTYVMFSDGSIEADTPRGRFTFASLDELKNFVNAGGEEARGAA
ncbi:MAG: hypothetical protein PGN25_19800 [Methylorubrum populi]